MIRRWSYLSNDLQFKTTLFPERLHNRMRVRKTKNYVRLKRFRFEPTYFLIKKQSEWLLRHDYRREYSFLTTWITFVVKRSAVYRFIDSVFSPKFSHCAFLHWRGGQNFFWSSAETTAYLTHFNPKARRYQNVYNWLSKTPNNFFFWGNTLNVENNETHESELTIVNTSQEKLVVSRNEIDLIFTDIYELLWIQNRHINMWLYQLMITVTLFNVLLRTFST